LWLFYSSLGIEVGMASLALALQQMLSWYLPMQVFLSAPFKWWITWTCYVCMVARACT
jgi:hypothetical protein